MTANLKYKSISVYWDVFSRTVVPRERIEKYRIGRKIRLPLHILHFASKHEFSVYLELLKVFPSSQIIPQCPIQILPPSKCYPNGKKWKVDFAIKKPSPELGVIALVEAKGIVTREFLFSICCFEQSQHSELFDRLWLVFPTDNFPRNQLIKNLQKSDFGDRIIATKDIVPAFKETHEHAY